jgi:hypothetical protein
MKWMPDKIGGNPKQYATLGVLVVALIGYYFLQRDDKQAATPVTTVAPLAKAPSIARQQSVSPEVSSGPQLATRGGSRDQSFRPSFKLPEGTDITKVDPRIKTELLAKLQQVPLAGGSRSVFDYSEKPVPPPPLVSKIKPEEIERMKQRERELASAPPPMQAKAPPPPIPLKFYGYANKQTGAARQAFFLDGDDIQIKGENDVIRGRYKIIRIGINSAVVEDVQTKDQQTLPLIAELNT